jgi:2-dehydropantoate 2-reductase
MKIGIVGAGAMGSLLGHGLQRGGHEVTLVDLPDRVEQIRAMGSLVIVSGDGSESTSVPTGITSDYEEVGVQELVILSTKAQDLPQVAENVPRLIGRDGVVVTIQNGIPWWYLQGLPGELGGARIACLDPNEELQKSIPAAQVVGCVAYPAASVRPDGRVHHVEGNRFPVGELDGSRSDRAARIAAAFEQGGFRSRVIEDIRSEIWLKALGALSINPISALSGATMAEICSFAPTRSLVATMMGEARQIAETLGATFRHSIEERIEGARKVGMHKTSMLQDVEAGRPLEIDALLLAVLELADLTRVDAPTIRSVYACVALLNERLCRMAGQGREP